MNHWLKGLGALRMLMLGFVVLLIATAPFSGGDFSLEGLAMLTTLVAPALTVIMLFVVPLDMIMSFIFRTDKTGSERSRLNRVLLIEAIAFISLVLSWLPFGLKLLRT